MKQISFTADFLAKKDINQAKKLVKITKIH